MSDDELAAIKKLGQDLRYWKKFSFPGFAAGVLNLDATVGSLTTPDHFVYARRDYASRWLVCKVGSQFKAMFHTAVVWSGSSHLETGNYVPEGQVPPTNIAEGRIQRHASNRCQIDYVIDTRFDKTLFSHQAKLEELVVKNTEFNKSYKPRWNWQRGDSGHDNDFTFSAQMFVRPYGYDVAKLKNPPYTLHPWVREAVQTKGGEQDYYANPHRPEIWDCATGTMVRIDKASPPFLQKGDIVWMSFHVEFIIGQNTWSTQLVPRHIIRVSTIPTILIDVAGVEDAAPEQEPDYTIKEGSTFAMIADYPMEDEMAPGIQPVSCDIVVDDKAPKDQAKLPVDNRLEDRSTPAPAQSTAGSDPSIRTSEKTIAVPMVSVEDALREKACQRVGLEHAERDTGMFDESLTPPPASPEPTTPAEWTPSPAPKSADEDGKNAVRGTKRAPGFDDDTVGAQPSKKGRQASGRRSRNV